MDKIPETSEWRFRREGDEFTPYGASYAKKLKEYFIDKKIPLRLRDNIPVLANGNQILIVAGVEIADSIKLSDESENVFKITYKKDLI